MLWAVCKRVRLLHRRVLAKQKELDEGDRKAARAVREPSTCHRLWYKLARRGYGVKGRRLGHLAASQPLLEEWTECVKLRGHNGGMAAIVIAYEV